MKSHTLDAREFDAAQEYRAAIGRLVDERPEHVWGIHLTPYALTVTTTTEDGLRTTTYTRKDSK